MKIFLIVFLLLSGCGRHLTKIENCIPRTSIFSTKEVEFYKVEMVNFDGTPRGLPDSLCPVVINSGGLCSSSVEKATLLPIGSEISFDGEAVKSVRQLVYSLILDSEHRTRFKGAFNGQVIWVSSIYLYLMFNESEKFKSRNISAFKLLNLDARGGPRALRNDIELEKILKWDCDIK